MVYSRPKVLRYFRRRAKNATSGTSGTFATSKLFRFNFLRTSVHLENSHSVGHESVAAGSNSISQASNFHDEMEYDNDMDPSALIAIENNNAEVEELVVHPAASHQQELPVIEEEEEVGVTGEEEKQEMAREKQPPEQPIEIEA